MAEVRKKIRRKEKDLRAGDEAQDLRRPRFDGVYQSANGRQRFRSQFVEDDEGEGGGVQQGEERDGNHGQRHRRSVGKDKREEEQISLTGNQHCF